MIKFY